MRLIHDLGGESIAFPLDEGETVIGRDDGCDVSFADASLSKRHARLVRRGGALTCFDAGSRNGTLVNGAPVPPDGVALRTGDVVQCGELSFRVEDVSAEDFTVLDDAPPERETSAARLVLQGGGRCWDLRGETLTIGSKAENAVVLAGDGVSRFHAEVKREHGAWVVADLGARNGVLVNGQRVDVHALHDGDELQVGTFTLRFELVAASPVRELASRLLADPAGTYRAEPGLRAAAAAGVVALLLLAIALATGTGPGSTTHATADLTWCDDATALLERGDHDGARRAFRRVVNQVPQGEQDLPRALGNVAAHWVDLPRDPRAFRWDKAADLAESALRQKRLPERARAWLEAQLVTARREEAASATLAEAEQAGAAALTLATAAGRTADAIRRIDAARDLFASVPAGSVFAARAADELAQLRAQGCTALRAHVVAGMAAPDPAWDDVIDLIAQTDDLADRTEHRLELQRMRGECMTNQRDEQLYQQAVTICAAHDVERYADALRLLDRIDRRSRIHEDARAYAQWIQADRAVRQAQREYSLGDATRAQALLTSALDHDALGQKARDSVLVRRTTWDKVARAFQAGMQHLEAGRHDAAHAEFARVVQFEPDRANRYTQLALQQIQHIARMKNLGLEDALRRGLDDLASDDLEGAGSYFAEVRRHPEHQERHLRVIADAVLEANRARRLLAAGQRQFQLNNAAVFPRIRAATKLLATWLPADDPDRAAAEKLFEAVDRRLRRR